MQSLMSSLRFNSSWTEIVESDLTNRVVSPAAAPPQVRSQCGLIVIEDASRQIATRGGTHAVASPFATFVSCSSPSTLERRRHSLA